MKLREWASEIGQLQWGNMLLSGLFLAGAGASLLCIGDCAAGHHEDSVGSVRRHGHRAAYTSVTIECAARDRKGNCTAHVPVTHYHPPQWWLVVDARRSSYSLGVGPATWNAVRDGEPARVGCRVGRWTGWCYLASYDGKP